MNVYMYQGDVYDSPGRMAEEHSDDDEFDIIDEKDMKFEKKKLKKKKITKKNKKDSYDKK